MSNGAGHAGLLHTLATLCSFSVRRPSAARSASAAVRLTPQTRYVVKFIPKTGQLVLKVTDDTKVGHTRSSELLSASAPCPVPAADTPQCIKYKTFSAIILNRFESLNLRLLSSITNARRRAPVVVGSGSAGAGTPTAERDDPLKAAAGSGSNTPQRKGTPAATPGAGGAGKKKKKGKR